MTAGPAASRPVTIVTWHYVRDGGQALHAVDLARFERQLDHIAARHVPVTVDDILTALSGEGELPEGACLLTFDDGYRDHHAQVFPRLAARGWQGVFFPVANAARDRRVLDVNRIQFAIAAVGLETIAVETRQAIDEARPEFDLPDTDTLYRELAVAGLHNAPEAMFVKRALQTALPRELRTRICGTLFARHVSADEASFAADLYADCDALREMHQAGMALGGHGMRHERMNALDAVERAREFEGSRAFLGELGVDTRSGWTFCYPYGAHDRASLADAGAADCSLAFTLEPRVADLAADVPLALPRLDANDIPG